MLLNKLVSQHSLRTATYYEQQLVAKLLAEEAPFKGWALRPFVAGLQREWLETVRRHDERDALSSLFEFEPGQPVGYDEEIAVKKRTLSGSTIDPADSEPAAASVRAVVPSAAKGRGRKAQRYLTKQADGLMPGTGTPPGPKAPARAAKPSQAPGADRPKPHQICLFENALLGMSCV